MKAKINGIFREFIFLLCLLPVWATAATYEVPTSTSKVDGETFCDGKCDSDDTIIITGGQRGSLKLQNFDGNGAYITITNENTNPNSRVVITRDSGYPLNLQNCNYVDLRGNNDTDITYGIKVISNKTPAVSALVLTGDCDYIKLSYLELTCEGATGEAGGGIKVGIGTDDDSMTYDTIEIHNNYIHDTRYSGMYIGSQGDGKPYVANVSIHDNILEDLGAYGITLKRVHTSSGVCSIYNNTIQGSNRASGNSTGLVSSKDGSTKHGIGVQYFTGASYADIYNNYIEKTVGPGLKIGDNNHKVNNNIIVECGTGDEVDWGHGIITYQGTYGSIIEDNIIIQPKRYGIYVLGTTKSVTLSMNKIGDAGLGEWYEKVKGDATESDGDDANIYLNDIVLFNFKAWSNDGDYSNDDFTSSISEKPKKVEGLRIIKESLE
jgi:parallel beta helix pectate lyase-like protein